MIYREHELQAACVRWFRLQYSHLFIFAIPNGGQRNRRAGQILVSEGMVSGVPDLFIPVARCGYNGLFIEMKAGKRGRTTTNQEVCMYRLRQLGYKCEVVRTFEDFVRVVNDYVKESVADVKKTSSKEV